jgi:hypothetical protein
MTPTAVMGKNATLVAAKSPSVRRLPIVPTAKSASRKNAWLAPRMQIVAKADNAKTEPA